MAFPSKPPLIVDFPRFSNGFPIQTSIDCGFSSIFPWFSHSNLHWLWIFLDFPMVFPFKPPLTVDFPRFSHGFPKQNIHWVSGFSMGFSTATLDTKQSNSGPGLPRPRNRRSWTKRFCHVGRWAPRTRMDQAPELTRRKSDPKFPPWRSNQWEIFRIQLMEVCKRTIFLAIFCGDIGLKNRPFSIAM